MADADHRKLPSNEDNSVLRATFVPTRSHRARPRVGLRAKFLRHSRYIHTYIGTHARHRSRLTHSSFLSVATPKPTVARRSTAAMSDDTTHLAPVIRRNLARTLRDSIRTTRSLLIVNSRGNATVASLHLASTPIVVEFDVHSRRLGALYDMGRAIGELAALLRTMFSTPPTTS